MQQCRDWAIFLARVYFANCCAILTCITTCKVNSCIVARQYKYQTKIIWLGADAVIRLNSSILFLSQT